MHLASTVACALLVVGFCVVIVAAACSNTPRATPSPAGRFATTSDAGVACTNALPESDCVTVGGVWDSGILGRGSCACPVSDGGRPCRTAADCGSTACEISWEDAVAMTGTRCGASGCEGPRAADGLPEGRCAAYKRSFGCRGWLVEEPGPSGPVRVARYVCRD